MPTKFISITCLISIITMCSCTKNPDQKSHEPEATVDLNPNPVTATFRQGLPPGQIQLNAFFSVPLNENSSARIEIPKGILHADKIDIYKVSDRHFCAYLEPKSTLDVGNHKGEIKLIVSNPKIESVVNFDFNILPGNVVKATIDKTPVPAIFCRYNGNGFPQLSSGQKVELTASLPVSWSVEFAWSAGSPQCSLLSSTDTTWSAIISDPTVGPDTCSGAVIVRVTPKDDPSNDFSINMTLYGKK